MSTATLLVVSISLLIPEVLIVGVPIFGYDIYDPQEPNERQL